MISKKVFFSMMTIPAAIMCHECSEFQKRRKDDKEYEVKRRRERLNSDPIDLTPRDGKFAFSGMSPEQIEEEYGFKRVKIRGLLDVEDEIKIQAYNRGEKGYYIVNPLYTHVNENKEPCGIMVNRGFIPLDYEHYRERLLTKNDGYFEGIIYCGDHMTKYDDNPNTPLANQWFKAVPKELSLAAMLKNREDSAVAMMMLVDFDEEHQEVHPSPPIVRDFVNWKNTPERHNAYQLFWKYTSYVNIFANTMFWLYF